MNVDGGVDLLLPPAAPPEVLGGFVAYCSIGECGCGDSFVARISGVELCDEPRRRRVRSNGTLTLDEVLAELAATSFSSQP